MNGAINEPKVPFRWPLRLRRRPLRYLFGRFLIKILRSSSPDTLPLPPSRSAAKPKMPILTRVGSEPHIER